MKKIFIALLALIGLFGLNAQTSSSDVRTLVVRTGDGNTTRFNIDDITEITFENAPAAVSNVTRMANLSPDFFSVSGVEENAALTPGETAVLTLKAGVILSAGFQDYHFEHIHIHVNEQVIVPVAPDGYTPVSELRIPFTVPEGDCDIVACYSVQQQQIESGFTMSLENHPNVRLYGVSPNCHYKYFDAYLLVDDAFVITGAEFKDRKSVV